MLKGTFLPVFIDDKKVFVPSVFSFPPRPLSPGNTVIREDLKKYHTIFYSNRSLRRLFILFLLSSKEEGPPIGHMVRHLLGFITTLDKAGKWNSQI